MTNLKLTYFDVHGGRGEPARLAMLLGDIAFEDERFPFSDFAEVRKNTPLGQVPILSIDGTQVTQCNGILRYVGKKTNLYPTDDYQGLLCDEVLGIVEDATQKLVVTFGMEGEVLKAARENMLKRSFIPALKLLNQRLEAAGSKYFCGDKLTIADLKVYVWVRALNAGHLDHVPTDLVEQNAPLLNAHYQLIDQTPRIAEYYANAN